MESRQYLTSMPDWAFPLLLVHWMQSLITLQALDCAASRHSKGSVQ